MNAIKENLKVEIDDILRNYNVPFEDRSLVLEKIDSSVDQLVKDTQNKFDKKVDNIRDEISYERNGIQKELDEIRNTAISSIKEINNKVDEAYEEGFTEASKLGSESKPSFFQIIIGFGLLALAIVVVTGTFFKASKK